ncbi:hypothetical protein N8Z70_04310 [Candidatus Puniceispirillum sp.]|nr:hypothetical protein [Candidatus Puniceispirillum sp.]
MGKRKDVLLHKLRYNQKYSMLVASAVVTRVLVQNRNGLKALNDQQFKTKAKESWFACLGL